MPRFNPRASRRDAAQRFTIQRINGICRVCGKPRDAFHDGGKCADLWVKQQDEEARKAREGQP